MTVPSELPDSLVDLIRSGPMCHLTTVNADGSPQVTVVWIGVDDSGLFTGHMSRQAKLRNIERDPRVVLSFDAPRTPGTFMNEYAVVQARGTVVPSAETWSRLNDLTKIYVTPETEFPAPPGPGFLVRYEVERIGGRGPWAAAKP